MKRIIKILLVFMILVLYSEINAFSKTEDDGKIYTYNTKRDLLVLMLAYPDQIKDIVKEENGLVFLVMKDDRKILYDDKKEKSHEEKFHNADLQDTLEEIYPLDKITAVMDENKDPGRSRCYALLGSMYGGSKAGVEKNLVYKDTCYGGISFNKVNDAAEKLQKALNRVGRLAEHNSKISSFVYPTSGTFNYRVIQDTGQLSPHAFAIAIDLKSDPSDYWKWCNKEKGSKRIAIYPEEIVKTFEAYGFVWGGKWSHFDILHFEYRPEIILKARYFTDKEVNGCDEWYEGCPMDEVVEKLIEKINNVIK